MSLIIKYRPGGSNKIVSAVINTGSVKARLLHKRNEPEFFERISETGIDTAEIISVHENKEFTYPFFDGLATISETEEDDNWGIEYLSGKKWQEIGSTGNGIRVGIADTGLNISHPCFQNLKLAKFVDIDRGNGNRQEVSPFDSQWHGTFCTAILAGKNVNGFNRGIAEQVELYVAKVFNKFNSSLTAVHSAFEFFIENKVHIVSFSMGAPNKEPIWAEIVRDYLDTGGIVVAGIGNDYLGDAPTISPANYPLPGLLAIGAHDIELNVWEKSGGGNIDWSNNESLGNYGSVIKPDLVAPGVGIVSIGKEQKAQIGAGTSFATPHIAGLLACLWSADPKLTRDKVIAKLKSLYIDKGAIIGHDDRYGNGIVDTTLFFNNH